MKTKFLLTTAMVTAFVSAPAMAEETSWFDEMKTSVQSWFATEPQTSSEVETYLDEVTIAVPPMTGAEAAAVEPAAGDYQETLEDAIQNLPDTRATQSFDEQSFNTDFSHSSESVAAFEGGETADDLANIMPAAGDAEEITDESVVVAEEAMHDMHDKADEMTENMAEAMDGFVKETQEQTAEATETMAEEMDAAHEATAEAVEHDMDSMTHEAEKMAADAQDVTTEEVVEDAHAMATDAVDEVVVETKEHVIEPAAGKIQPVIDEANDTMDDMIHKNY